LIHRPVAETRFAEKLFGEKLFGEYFFAENGNGIGFPQTDGTPENFIHISI
jgi:hypothetical protein